MNYNTFTVKYTTYHKLIGKDIWQKPDKKYEKQFKHTHINDIIE